MKTIAWKALYALTAGVILATAERAGFSNAALGAILGCLTTAAGLYLVFFRGDK